MRLILTPVLHGVTIQTGQERSSVWLTGSEAIAAINLSANAINQL